MDSPTVRSRMGAQREMPLTLRQRKESPESHALLRSEAPLRREFRGRQPLRVGDPHDITPPLPDSAAAPEAALWRLPGSTREDRDFRHRILRRYCSNVAWPLARAYQDRYDSFGRRSANLWLLDATERLNPELARLASSDYQVRRFAENRAKQAQQILQKAPTWREAHARLAAHTMRHGYTPPLLDGHNITMAGATLRMACPKWWRRQIRARAAREIENHLRRLGFVRAGRSLYASDLAIGRRREQKIRNRLLAQVLHLVNDDGEYFSLEELIERSTSNPVNRRNELMTRIAGFEKLSKDRGDRALFITLTTPSRFHAYRKGAEAQNSKFDRSTVTEAQEWLNTEWRTIRTYFSRAGIRPYGFRIAEPHHDGTPHWHLLLFLPRTQAKAAKDIMRSVILRESPEEPGAQKHRFDCTPIDYDKGTAAGYIAKYVAKNIDGFGGGDDHEDPVNTSLPEGARRADAWAATWGIRQFQQIGGPPVGVWRELRRISPDQAPPDLRELVVAADDGDWAGFVRLMGGPGCTRQELRARLLWKRSSQPGLYGDFPEMAVGIEGPDTTVTTRTKEWRLILISERERDPMSQFSTRDPTRSSLESCQ